MRLHLEALALLERVWGVLGLITSASLLMMAIGTWAAIDRQGLPIDTHDAPIWLLGGMGVTLAVFSGGALAASRGLRLRRTAGRIAALAFAIPNLVVVPFGTALGVYTFWVLLNDDARAEFGRPLRGPAAR